MMRTAHRPKLRSILASRSAEPGGRPSDNNWCWQKRARRRGKFGDRVPIPLFLRFQKKGELVLCRRISPSVWPRFLPQFLFVYGIVRRFLRDEHIVHVALTKRGFGNLHEPGLGLKFFDRGHSAVAHSGAQPTNK